MATVTIIINNNSLLIQCCGVYLLVRNEDKPYVRQVQAPIRLPPSHQHFHNSVSNSSPRVFPCPGGRIGWMMCLLSVLRPDAVHLNFDALPSEDEELPREWRRRELSVAPHDQRRVRGHRDAFSAQAMPSVLQ